MRASTHDGAERRTPSTSPAPGSGTAGGLLLAVVAAASFGLSGALARGLLDSGWSVGAAVFVRIGLGALVLAVPASLTMRGRWSPLRPQAARLVVKVLVFGVVAVAGVQFAFFQAVARLPVGVAILVEYTSPVAVVGWFWLRHRQRPGPLTVAGGLLAAVGLLLVLDLTGVSTPDPVGLAWALVAMVAVTAYFVMPSSGDDGLPPLALAAAGLLVGSVALAAAGLAGWVPFAVATASVTYAAGTAPWWVVVLALGLMTSALSYGTGVAATRRLGARLASFVALTEVLAAMLWAWVLVAELPTAWQAVGGASVLAGVVVVKLGEPTASGPPAAAGTPR